MSDYFRRLQGELAGKVVQPGKMALDPLGQPVRVGRLVEFHTNTGRARQGFVVGIGRTFVRVRWQVNERRPSHVALRLPSEIRVVGVV